MQAASAGANLELVCHAHAQPLGLALAEDRRLAWHAAPQVSVFVLFN